MSDPHLEALWEIRRIANEPGDRRSIIDRIYGIATEAGRVPAQRKNHGDLRRKLSDLRGKIALDILEANDCGELGYAEGLCEMDELFAACEAALSSDGIAEGREAAPGLPVANEHREAQACSGTLERSLDRSDVNPQGGAVAPDTRQPAAGVESCPSDTSTPQAGMIERLANWFNSLPGESLGEQHWNRLVEIVQSPSSSGQTKGGEA